MDLMAKTSKQIEEIRQRMMKDPRQANFAQHMINPETEEGQEKIKKFQAAGVKASAEARRLRKEKDIRIKEKAAEMAETLAAINSVAQDPLDVMKLLMHEAMEDGDREEAFKIAKELGEYKAPKKTRVESVTTERSSADLSVEELEELAQLKKDLGG
jgi:hypothetical protein